MDGMFLQARCWQECSKPASSVNSFLRAGTFLITMVEGWRKILDPPFLLVSIAKLSLCMKEIFSNVSEYEQPSTTNGQRYLPVLPERQCAMPSGINTSFSPHVAHGKIPLLEASG